MSFSADSMYDDVLRFYFADTPDIGKAVWERYTQYVNSDFADNPTFVQFLENSISKPGSIATLSSITSVPKGACTNYLTYYFNDRIPEERLDIYKAFLAYKGYPSQTESEPSQEEIASDSFQKEFGQFVYNLSNYEKSALASLKTFVSQYNAYGFGKTALNLSEVTSIPSEFYADNLKAFFGGRSNIELLDIWRAFLVSIGYPKVDPTTHMQIFQPSTTELASSTMKLAFSRYIEAIRDKELYYGSVTSESPHTTEVNTILYSVIDSIRNMLNTTELLVQNQANSLIVSGKVQQEYTTMLSRVPNLTPGVVENITVPSTTNLESGSWDPKNFLFGYNNISLQDVIEWGVEKALNNKDTIQSWGLDTTNGTTPISCYFNFQIKSGSTEPSTYLPTLSSTSSAKTTIEQSWTGSFALSPYAELSMLRAFSAKWELDHGSPPSLTDASTLTELGTQVATWATTPEITDETSLINYLSSHDGITSQAELDGKSPSSLTPWDDLRIIMQKSFSSSSFTLSSTQEENIVKAFVVVQAHNLGIDTTAIDMTDPTTLAAFTTYVNSLPHTASDTLDSTLTADASTAKGIVYFEYNFHQIAASFSLTDSNGTLLSRSELYTQASNAMKAVFAQDVATVVSLGNVVGIPGRYLTPSDGTTDQSQDDIEARALQNAVLQQYMEHIRTLRDAAKNISKTLQTTVSETKNTIDKHTALWTSILEMIDSIIHAIFQKK